MQKHKTRKSAKRGGFWLKVLETAAVPVALVSLNANKGRFKTNKHGISIKRSRRHTKRSRKHANVLHP